MLVFPARKFALLTVTIFLILTLITVSVIYLVPSKEKVDLAVEAVKAQKPKTAIAEVEENKMFESEKEEQKALSNVNTGNPNKSTDIPANNNTATPTPKGVPSPKLSPNPYPSPAPARSSDKMIEPIKDTPKPMEPTSVSNNKPGAALSTTAPVTAETNKKAPVVENTLSSPITLKKEPDVVSKSDTLKEPMMNSDVLPLATTDSAVSESVNSHPPPPPSVKHLELREIQIVPCGIKKKFACNSFVISGFSDDHIVKVFFANNISSQPEIFVKSRDQIDDRNDFVAEEVIKDLSEAVEVDGVKIQFTKLDIANNIVESFKSRTFVQLFNPISHKIKNDTDFYVVVSGPADKVQSYDLGQKMTVKVKGSLLSQTEGRVSGYFEISGFDDTEKIIKIFMSLIKKDEQKYYEINNELLRIDEDKVEEEVTRLLRKEGKITEHKIGDITFKHTNLSSYFSFYKSSEQQEFENFKKLGSFTKYFTDLLSRKSSISSKNFFFILIGKKEEIENFKLTEEQKN